MKCSKIFENLRLLVVKKEKGKISHEKAQKKLAYSGQRLPVAVREDSIGELADRKDQEKLTIKKHEEIFRRDYSPKV